MPSAARHPEVADVTVQRAGNRASRERRRAVAHARTDIHSAKRCPGAVTATTVAQRRVLCGLPLLCLIDLCIGQGQLCKRPKARVWVEVAPT